MANDARLLQTSAQSNDSLDVRLCWRLSYKNGIITVILRAFPPTAAIMRFKSAKWSSGDIWFVCPQREYVRWWFVTSTIR